MVSARTVGRDGHTFESTPPDRVIEVKVGSNRRLAAARWAGWIAALLALAAIGIYGEQIWAVAVPAITMAIGRYACNRSNCRRPITTPHKNAGTLYSC